jgi:autotransporter-associated beta strand protein
LLSDLVISQDNYPNLNTGTIFSNLVSGAANLTLTKNGHGGLQFNYNNPLPSETPFQGKVVINQGGIRLLTPSPFSNVSEVTINSGGQLMLADNAQNTSNTDWDLASGAVLILNGPGKATDTTQTVINPDGALRFNVAQVTSTNFNNPVVLQSDSVISVPLGTITGTITNTVSGSGGLTKHGAGTLILSHNDNSYQGDTRILGGTLSIASAFLNNSADVYLTTGSVFNLNFSGVDAIRSLFVDGVAQPVGTYDAGDLGGLLITGTGSLQVTTLPVIEDADFNEDGSIDGRDFLIWQRNFGGTGGLDAGDANGDTMINGDDLAIWRDQFGEALLVAPGVAAPEPSTSALTFVLAAAALAGERRRRF